MPTPSYSSPFLNRVSEAIRVRPYSIRTEQAGIDWTKRFILFHDKKYTKEWARNNFPFWHLILARSPKLTPLAYFPVGNQKILTLTRLEWHFFFSIRMNKYKPNLSEKQGSYSMPIPKHMAEPKIAGFLTDQAVNRDIRGTNPSAAEATYWILLFVG